MKLIMDDIFEEKLDEIITPEVPRKYETADLLFAAILYTKRKTLVDIKQSDYNRAKKVFIWKYDEEIGQLRSEFLKRELRIEPLDLWSAVRHMKGLLSLDNLV